MAKEKFTITVDATVNDGMLYKTEFADQLSAMATGDKFWIPTADLMVVFGTAVNAGQPNQRALGERIFVVRLDKDNNPTEVSQLFVSQMARKDGKTNKYVFPKNELAEAHRLGMRYFKNHIADHVISVGTEKEYNARIWNDEAKAWLKEGDKYKTDLKPTFELKLTAENLSEENVSKAIALLVDMYKSIPSITVSVDEE